MPPEITTIILLLAALLCFTIVATIYLVKHKKRLVKVTQQINENTSAITNRINDFRQQVHSNSEKQSNQLLSITNDLSSAIKKIQSLEKAHLDASLKTTQSLDKVNLGLLDNKTAMRGIIQDIVSQLHTVVHASEAKLGQEINKAEQRSATLISELDGAATNRTKEYFQAIISQLKDYSYAINTKLDNTDETLDNVSSLATVIFEKISAQDSAIKTFLGKLEKQVALFEQNNGQFGEAIGKIDSETYVLVKIFSAKAEAIEYMIASVTKDHNLMLELLKLGLMNDVLKDLERAAESNPAG